MAELGVVLRQLRTITHARYVFALDRRGSLIAAAGVVDGSLTYSEVCAAAPGISTLFDSAQVGLPEFGRLRTAAREMAFVQAVTNDIFLGIVRAATTRPRATMARLNEATGEARKALEVIVRAIRKSKSDPEALIGSR